MFQQKLAGTERDLPAVIQRDTTPDEKHWRPLQVVVRISAAKQAALSLHHMHRSRAQWIWSKLVCHNFLNNDACL